MEASLKNPNASFLRCKICWLVAVGAFIAILLTESLLMIPIYQRFQTIQLNAAKAAAKEAIEAFIQFEQDLSLHQKITNVSNTLTEYSVIKGAMFYNEAGQVVASYGDLPEISFGQLKQAIEGPPSKYTHGKHWFDAAWGPDQLQAPYYVSAHIEIDYIYQAQKRFWLFGLSMVLAIALLVTILVSLLMGRIVLKPILGLRRQLLLAEADPDNPNKYLIETHKHHEVGDVTRGFNDLLERLQENLTLLKSHDIATGLPNRFLFENLFEKTLQWRKQKSSKVVIMTLTCTNFTSIHQTLGHQAWEHLLKLLADHIVNCLPLGAVIGRVGENELGIIISEVSNITEISGYAEDIITATKGIYHLEQNDVNIDLNIGISIYPDDSKNMNELLKFSGMALYYASSDPQEDYHFFAEFMNDELQERHDMAMKLHQALNEDHLELYYQPQYDLRTREITGFETLLRWHDPELGDISPEIFITLAEESSLIHDIGNWVFAKALQQCQAWRDKYGIDVKIAINLSAKQFNSDELTTNIQQILQQEQLSASLIELEITETAFAENMENTLEKLAQLRELGLNIAIDDFGTGYSSLSYLQNFPVQRLKIDKTFIQQMEVNPKAEAIVSTIVKLGHSLGLNVIAEGVENKMQLDRLMIHQCDDVQGFYFSKPLSVKAAEALLQKG